MRSVPDLKMTENEDKIVVMRRPTEIIAAFVMFADGCLRVLLTPVEHRSVEICLRHSATVLHRVATHYVVANDSTKSVVLKARSRRIQDEPPPFLHFSIDLFNQRHFSLHVGLRWISSKVHRNPQGAHTTELGLIPDTNHSYKSPYYRDSMSLQLLELLLVGYFDLTFLTD